MILQSRASTVLFQQLFADLLETVKGKYPVVEAYYEDYAEMLDKTDLDVILIETPANNLDRMLHRGEYSNNESLENKSKWTWRNVYGKLIGIDDEYTRGDKVIAWSVFSYAVVSQFFIAFVGV